MRASRCRGFQARSVSADIRGRCANYICAYRYGVMSSTCYVCYERTSKSSPCACKSLHVCNYCLHQLVNKYGYTRCTVCAAKYPCRVIYYRFLMWMSVVLFMYYLPGSSRASHTPLIQHAGSIMLQGSELCNAYAAYLRMSHPEWPLPVDLPSCTEHTLPCCCWCTKTLNKWDCRSILLRNFRNHRLTWQSGLANTLASNSGFG